MADIQFKRLFDVFYYQQKHTPNPSALCEKVKGDWKCYSTEECLRYVNRISRALMGYGIQKGDRIAVIATSSPLWVFIDMGIGQVGAISVPIYPNISEEEYKFILKDSEARLCFVGDKTLYGKIAPMHGELPGLENIYCLQQYPDIPFWEELLPMGEKSTDAQVRERMDGVGEEELATIIYTSGTTGTPKGVMLSHKNVVTNAKDAGSVIPLKAYHRTVSMLPICHIFERTVFYLCAYYGASIHYIGLESIGEDLKTVRPHFFSTVPRILEKVYEKIMQKGQSLTGMKRKIFDWAHSLAEKYDTPEGQGLWYDLQLSIANRLVFKKWREATGGHLFGIVSGAAAMQPRLGRIFTAAGIPVKEGFGQTEASPVIAVNRFTKGGTRFGTVGPAIPHVEVKIADDGEILARGANLMMGYYKRPDLTAETIDSEGWLHTGDVGEMDKDGFLKITDRKKELFKTSGGKYVAPQVIENKFKESFLVEQIMVVGENRKTISALIVPSFVNLAHWCRDNNIQVDGKESMVRHPEVIKHFAKLRDGFNKGFGEVEKVRKFVLLPDEWTVDGGEMTPTLKLKRRKIAEKYEGVIAELYGDE